MQANPHAPARIFSGDVRYVVPLFQRPYVWKRAEQWEPLWEDIRVLAERVLSAPTGYGAPAVAPHFLGAIVLEQQAIPAGYVAVRHVVDGQQRLTTLQLLMDAVEEVTRKYGSALDAEALQGLVRNRAGILQRPDDAFKVWPTDRDQAAFRLAMSGGEATDDLASSGITQARAFFVEQATEWAQAEDEVAERLNALVRALHEHLRIVVIDLEPGDNAQVIFETLNHRGAELLAADLVKNYLFQVAQAQGADVQPLYDGYWKELDNDYWRGLVPQGRRTRPRIDVFLTYWLTMQTRKEVPGDHVFDVFKTYMSGRDVTATIVELSRDAGVYARMESLPPTSVEGAFHYRVLRALDTASVGPVLLWLLRWPEAELPVGQRHRALRAIESWVLRRTLCRLTGKNTNLVILELLQQIHDSGPAKAGERTEEYLGRQTADARLWPDDEALRLSLADLPIYTAITRPRLRMLLEALEDDLRGGLGEGEACPHNLTVEHVMPRGWREHWDSGLDPIQAAARDRLVHTLGNLSLASAGLNPTLSNRPWTTAETENKGLGDKGKRDLLLEHSSLKLNAKLVAGHESSWTEADVRARTETLSARVVALWPRPAGPSTPAFLDQVVESVPDEPEVDLAALYRPLGVWLNGVDRDDVRLTFDQVERLLGTALPMKARTEAGHWAQDGDSALVQVLETAGWLATSTDLVGERVELIRIAH